MKNVIRRFLSNQEGSVLVFVAIMVFVLFGMMVLVIDVGKLTNSRRHLVAAADAAALAGAQELVALTGSETETELIPIFNRAKDQVADYAILNTPEFASMAPADKATLKELIKANTVVKHTATEKYVYVPLTNDNIDLYFARIFDREKGIVSAKAKATYEYPTSFKTSGGSGNLLPILIEESRYDQIYDTDITKTVTVVDKSILEVDGMTINGNWGFASIGGNGEQAVEYWLSAGKSGKADVPVDLHIGSEIDTKPGNLGNNTVMALNLRKNSNIPMYGLVPIVEFPDDKSGKTDSIIKKFAVFEILNYGNGFINGVFRPDIPPPDFIGGTSSESTYSKGSKIIMLCDI